MLARTIGPKFDSFPCYLQPKLNGVRALFQRGQDIFWTFQSRDEKTWATGLLHHLGNELTTLNIGSLILDGEFYVHSWRLQRINGAIATNRKEPSLDTPHICFHVFDVVDPNKIFSHRWFEMYNILQDANLPHILPVPTHLVQNRGEVELYFNQYTAQGYEGVMLRPDGCYEFGEHYSERSQGMTEFRSPFLWKYKSWLDGEWQCVGVTQGEGKADIGVGALVLVNYSKSTHKETSTFKVGTGLTDEERIEFMQNPPIGKMVKIRYLCLTDDGIPFNPSFLCIVQ